MFQSKKSKKIVDSHDRSILRLLYSGQRTMTGNQISKKINMSPPAINLRLSKLQNSGLIKKVEVGNQRVLRIQKSGNVTAPSRIFWGLDIVKTKKFKKLH